MKPKQSPADLEAGAKDTLNASEEYLRSYGYLSDDELRAELRKTLASEKASLARRADSGEEYFILSSAGRMSTSIVSVDATIHGS